MGMIAECDGCGKQEPAGLDSGALGSAYWVPPFNWPWAQPDERGIPFVVCSKECVQRAAARRADLYRRLPLREGFYEVRRVDSEGVERKGVVQVYRAESIEGGFGCRGRIDGMEPFGNVNPTFITNEADGLGCSWRELTDEEKKVVEL